MDKSEISEGLRKLVSKGIIEQYIDDDGEFCWGLTDFGIEVAEYLREQSGKESSDEQEGEK
tara:strand:- start:765 stop:947 length:183 start_codon:yes stop_codon:yes gene_type:complete